MSKRAPAGRLTQDNWDDDEDSEDPGQFQTADKQKLSERVIKKAKRRGAGEMTDGSGGLFKGFTGFTGTSSSNSDGISSSFSFASKPTQKDGRKTFSFTDGSSPASAAKTAQSESNTEAYFSKLKSLNRDLVNWIKLHVEKNPYCVLTPVFADYEKHLSAIEKMKTSDVENILSKDVGISGIPPVIDTKTDTVSSFTNAISKNNATKPFSFQLTSNPVNFGKNSSSGFKFGSVPEASQLPSIPGNMNQGNSNAGNDEEEEYVPPKVEVKEIKEEGSLLTMRCKLFYKNKSEWKEKGIGNLHLKEIDSGKAQLIIRADTNLGNVLLNILLTKEVPFNQNKNNMTLVCVPSPPIDPAKPDDKDPVSMLVRVKTETDAAKLVSQINKLVM